MLTNAIRFVFRAVIFVAALIVLLNIFYPAPIEYLEWKWGAETRLTPTKPFEEVQVRLMEDRLGRYFEAETEPLLAKAATGDPEAIRGFAEKLREHKASVGTVHEAYSGVSIQQGGARQQTPPAPSGPTSEQLAQLPPTPTGVEVEQLEGGKRRISFPPNQLWPATDVLADGETAWPDPDSRYWFHRVFGITGPNGSGKLANNKWRPRLPDGSKLFGAIVLKIEGRTVKATVNDFKEGTVDINNNGIPDDGLGDNNGRPAFIVGPVGSQ